MQNCKTNGKDSPGCHVAGSGDLLRSGVSEHAASSLCPEKRPQVKLANKD